MQGDNKSEKWFPPLYFMFTTLSWPTRENHVVTPVLENLHFSKPRKLTEFEDGSTELTLNFATLIS